MKQEPVAWMDSDGFAWTKQGMECRTTPDTYIPLYTEPQYSELSDDEILQIYTKHSTYDNDQRLFVDIYGFSRAILRKAQEK